MQPLRLIPEVEPVAPPRPGLTDLAPNGRHFLNQLRLVALQCRVSARTDLFEACRILSDAPAVAQNAYAEALMKCLGQALGKPPVMFRPGVEEVSFDEAWLLRAITSVVRQDWDSVQFLLASRIPLHARRSLADLLVGVSAQFELI